MHTYLSCSCHVDVHPSFNNTLSHCTLMGTERNYAHCSSQSVHLLWVPSQALPAFSGPSMYLCCEFKQKQGGL